MIERAAPLTVDLQGQLGAFALEAAFKAPNHGVTALFGPSGCGKTTVLRCIAGLVRLKGRLQIGDDIWQDTAAGIFLKPHQRHVGYVFQEASLFPHINVRDNLLYGARRARSDPATNGLELGSIVELLGIGRLLDRSPTTLSGGERQRVAVGRALLSGPRVLLMDEPLSALDRMTKEEILPYFEMLHEALSIPIVYVTHDFAEIERLADTLVLMDKGKIVSAGPLVELQTDVSLPLVRSREASVVVEGRIIELDRAFDITRFEIQGGNLQVPGLHGAVGDIRRLSIAASDVSLSLSAAQDTTILNSIPARIVSVSANQSEPQATVILGLGENGAGDRMVARITRKSLTNLSLNVGQPVFAQLKSVALIAARSQKQSPQPK